MPTRDYDLEGWIAEIEQVLHSLDVQLDNPHLSLFSSDRDSRGRTLELKRVKSKIEMALSNIRSINLTLETLDQSVIIKTDPSYLNHKTQLQISIERLKRDINSEVGRPLLKMLSEGMPEATYLAISAQYPSLNLPFLVSSSSSNTQINSVDILATIRSLTQVIEQLSTDQQEIKEKIQVGINLSTEIKEGVWDIQQKLRPIDDLPLKLVRAVEEVLEEKIENLRDHYAEVSAQRLKGREMKCCECGGRLDITERLGEKFTICLSCKMLYVFK